MSTVRIHDSRPSTVSTKACAVLIVGLAAQLPARAAWEIVPELGIGAQTENNARLNPDGIGDTSAATSTVLTAGANFSTLNERSLLSFQPAITSYRYSDSGDEELESDDWYFDSQGEYRWTTVSAGFNASFARERLLDAELVDVDEDNNPDTEDPDAGDTGRLAFIGENRERYRVTPTVSFRVSERNSLRFEGTRYGYRYSGGDRLFRTGWDSTRFAAAIDRNVDERNIISAVMQVESYDAEGTQNSTDTVSIVGTFRRPVTQLWTVSLSAGVLRSDFEFSPDGQQLTDGATTDYTMRLGFRKRAERSRMNIDFLRDVYPSGSGFSSIRREFRIYYDRGLTPRLDARFGVRLNETTSLGDINRDDNREYTRAEVGFEWAMKPVLFLEAGYQFTAQDFTEDFLTEEADSNAIYVGINYRGLSRQR